MATQDGIVADGHERAWMAMDPRIRAEVMAEYAARLEQATTFWERWRLWREIEREIDRRIDEKAPPDALY